jgi:general secretion pathway protein K
MGNSIGRDRGSDMALGNRRGIALLAVLGALVLLSVIAAAFVTETRTETKLARNAALADAGVQRAVLALLDTRGEGDKDDDEDEEEDDEDEEDEEDEEDRAPGPAAVAGWRVDGTVYRWTFAGEEVLISVQDETGRIDLNRAQEELLRGLFESVGVEAEEAGALVDAIADFRDEDDLTRLSGAEDDDYRAAGLAWGAKDARFETVAELQQVLGMTRELYEQVAPLVTVYSKRPGIQPRVAPRGVLLALPGIIPSEVDAYVAARAASGRRLEGALPLAQPVQDDGAEENGDQDYENDNEESAFGEYDPETEALPKTAEEDRYYTFGRSRFTYSIRAEARTAAGAVFMREAVVRLTRKADQPFQVLAWKPWKHGGWAPPVPQETE